MNILFLGGNRYFGKKLVKKLSLVKKYKIFILNRGNKKLNKDLINKKNIYFIECDRKNKTDLTKKIINLKVNIVVDNCAYTLNDVKNLIHALKNQKFHYYFTSTVMSYLNLYLDRELKEKDWLASKSTKNMELKYLSHEIEYAKNKRNIEKYLISQKNIKYLIFRVHNILGSDDFSKKTSKFLTSSFDQVIDFLDKKNNYFQYIFDEDLVNIIYHLIVNKPKVPKIYNLCNDPVDVNDFYVTKSKYIAEKYNTFVDSKFPFPTNVIMNNDKIKKEVKFKFTKLDKILKNLVKLDEFK